jgi:hypothetical protein
MTDLGHQVSLVGIDKLGEKCGALWDNLAKHGTVFANTLRQRARVNAIYAGDAWAGSEGQCEAGWTAASRGDVCPQG